MAAPFVTGSSTPYIFCIFTLLSWQLILYINDFPLSSYLCLIEQIRTIRNMEYENNLKEHCSVLLNKPFTLIDWFINRRESTSIWDIQREPTSIRDIHGKLLFLGRTIGIYFNLGHTGGNNSDLGHTWGNYFNLGHTGGNYSNLGHGKQVNTKKSTGTREKVFKNYYWPDITMSIPF